MPTKHPISRRELIQQFGMAAFLLHPILLSMKYAMAAPAANFPRFVMYFKGGALIPRTNNPSSLDNLSGTALAPLQKHAADLVLFKNMHTTGGEPIPENADNYNEEHGGGLFGCVTGNTYKYSGQDAYFAYTDNESIDISIANFYKSRPELKHLAFPSLHLGAGAHSDSDETGLGNKFISFRKRMQGDTRYGNSMVPIQNAEQVYKTLMTRVSSLCASSSLKPEANSRDLQDALDGRKSVLDFILSDLADAKRQFGLDSEHARKLDGMVEGWRETEKQSQGSTTEVASTRPCPVGSVPKGDGTNMKNLDDLSPVYDQMTQLMKLAFQWDLTRVIAFTASGASCGQYLPSRGVHEGRHTLEHAGNESAMLKIDTFHMEKFANFLSALKEINDGNGQNALFNTSIILGQECWSSEGHYLKNIPYVLAGQGGGRFKTGQIVNAQGRSNNDLLVSCLQASGMQTNVFGLPSLCKGPII